MVNNVYKTPFTLLARFWNRLENNISIIILLSIAVLPITEIVARLAFKTGVKSSSDYVCHLVIWITFIGGMITSREGRHLSLSTGINLIKEPLKHWLESFTSCIAVTISVAFAWNSYSFIRLVFWEQSNTVGIFPSRYIMMIMPVGFLFMTLRFISRAPSGLTSKLVAASGIAIAFLISILPAEHTSLLVIPVIIMLIVAALLGTPIFLALGGIAAILFFNSSGSIAAIPNEAYSSLIGPAIPTIPLFTLAGFILSESKAGERLVHFFKAAFGWLPGGLPIMATLVCAFFTTFTGASGVTILALGGLLYYILTNSKYPKEFTTGLLTASGSIGLLFPPSLPIILYGVVAHISIKKMFIGGIIPGILMVAVVASIGIYVAIKNKVERTPFEIHKVLRSLGEAWLELLLPVIILVCFFKGYTNLVETGAVAVLYTLIVQVFIRRDIPLKKLPEVFQKCVPIIGGVLVIIAIANGLKSFIIDEQIPMQLATWCQTHISSKYMFLLILNLLLLVVGCFLDIFSAIIVVVPLIIPLGAAYGIHPVHLGIIFLANLELGYLTPPVGLNLFLSSYRFNIPLLSVCRYVIPFLITLLISVLLITYIPWMTTSLLDVITVGE